MPASNQYSGPAVWRAIADAAGTDIRVVFAQNAWVPLDISELSCAPIPITNVWENVAIRTAHRAVLDGLLADEHPDVPAAALRNSLTTEHDVGAAAADQHLVVRVAAAASPVPTCG